MVHFIPPCRDNYWSKNTNPVLSVSKQEEQEKYMSNDSHYCRGNIRTMEKKVRETGEQKFSWFKNQPYYHSYNWTLGPMMDPVLDNVQRQLQLTPTGTERQHNMRVKKCGQVLAICTKPVLKPVGGHGLLTQKLKKPKQPRLLSLEM